MWSWTVTQLHTLIIVIQNIFSVYAACRHYNNYICVVFIFQLKYIMKFEGWWEEWGDFEGIEFECEIFLSRVIYKYKKEWIALKRNTYYIYTYIYIHLYYIWKLAAILYNITIILDVFEENCWSRERENDGLEYNLMVYGSESCEQLRKEEDMVTPGCHREPSRSIYGILQAKKQLHCTPVEIVQVSTLD